MVMPDSLLDSLRLVDESVMPDELRLQTAATATDGFDHVYETGEYTTAYTVPCRRTQLSGRNLEVAQSLAGTAQGEIACPLGTPVTVGQRFEVYAVGLPALTARVVWIDQDTYQTSVRFYYERVTP